MKPFEAAEDAAEVAAMFSLWCRIRMDGERKNRTCNNNSWPGPGLNYPLFRPYLVYEQSHKQAKSDNQALFQLVCFICAPHGVHH